MSLEEQIGKAVKDAMTPLIEELQNGIQMLIDVSELATKKRYADDDLLDPKEVAELLKIKVTTLEQWRTGAKYLPFSKAGGSVRYRFRDVKNFIHRNVQKVMDEKGMIIR